MLPVRSSQMGLGLPDPTAAPDVDSHAWTEAVGKTLLAERVVPGLRIFGALGYLSDLAQGRMAAVGGQAPAQAAPGSRQSLERSDGRTGPGAAALALSLQPEQFGHAPEASRTRKVTDTCRRRRFLAAALGQRGESVDDSPETMPAFGGDIETDVKELMGLFDVPAFARRGLDLEFMLRRLQDRCRIARRSFLEMVRLRLRQWSAAVTGPASCSGVFTSSIEPLWTLAEAEPPRWSTALASLRRQQSVARDLRAAVLRFNGRWLHFLEHLNLEPTNSAIDEYNRYYLLEKECVMGSARLAARFFTPVAKVTKESLLQDHPFLPVPELAGEPARLERG